MFQLLKIWFFLPSMTRQRLKRINLAFTLRRLSRYKLVLIPKLVTNSTCCGYGLYSQLWVSWSKEAFYINSSFITKVIKKNQLTKPQMTPLQVNLVTTECHGIQWWTISIMKLISSKLHLFLLIWKSSEIINE